MNVQITFNSNNQSFDIKNNLGADNKDTNDKGQIQISNLNENVNKNQFTNLHLPIKHEVFSYLEPKAYGILALVNKILNNVVFPNAEEKDINGSLAYKGFLCLSLFTKLGSSELPMRLFKKYQLTSINDIDEKYLPDIENKMNLVLAPIKNKIIDIFSYALYNKKNMTNKNLLEMLSLAKNPLLITMFNLAGEMGMDIFPSLLEDFAEDTQLREELGALDHNFEIEIQGAREKSKKKREALAMKQEELEVVGKREHTSRLSSIHNQLKNIVKKVPATQRGVGVQVPLPIVPVFPPGGAAAGLFGRIREVLNNPVTEKIAIGVVPLLGTAIWCAIEAQIAVLQANNTSL